MISPLASPMRGWRNLTPFRGRGRGGQNPWTPAQLGLYAWYDAHAGGSSTQITDSSGNGRAATAFAATTNSPLFLPYTGTPYLHLEAAGAGTNSLSCTAPANTASYSATPLGGGAASTGAAAAGAFTFTTAGDWASVELLDGSANVLARFRASDSTQTGHTDTFSVAWTINRGTAGRKSVILGPAANSTRSLVLFGTDDYATVPAAAIPPMGAADSFTWVVVCRIFPTAVTNADLFGKHVGYSGATNPGVGVAPRSATTIGMRAKDGTNQVIQAPTFTPGLRLVLSSVVSSSQFITYVDNTATAVARGAVADMTNAATAQIGRSGTTPYADMQFSALLTADRVLTAGEIGQVVSYYGGGT